jgi:hypothetical protein
VCYLLNRHVTLLTDIFSDLPGTTLQQSSVGEQSLEERRGEERENKLGAQPNPTRPLNSVMDTIHLHVHNGPLQARKIEML